MTSRSFDRPEVLLALWLMPVVFLVMKAHAARYARDLQRFGIERLPVGCYRRTPRRSSERWLVLAAVFCGAVAAAGPRMSRHPQEVNRSAAEIMIVVDVSKSMFADDLPPSRLDEAVQQLARASGAAEASAVGVLAFAGDAVLVCPLTPDRDAVRSVLEELADPPVSGGSALAAGLALAGDAFSRDEQRRAIVIVTDGEDTEGGINDVVKALDARHVQIHAVGVGTYRGAPLPRSVEGAQKGIQRDENGAPVITTLNEDLLENISSATRGTYTRLRARGDLLKLFTQLGDRRGSSIGSPRRDDGLIRVFMAAALVLLSIDLGLQAHIRHS